MSQKLLLLRKAQTYLRSAAVLLEMEDYDSCASRSYFAMFYAAQALLAERRVSTSGGIRVAFGDAFVRPGEVPEEAGLALDHAHDLMEVADYAHSFGVQAAQAEDVLQHAEAFVAMIFDMLNPLPPSAPEEDEEEDEEENEIEPDAQ
jgi:uncharacterized protein (UPF0332 family)